MSPVGGVGINLEIQDAIAAANILALPGPALNGLFRAPVLAVLECRAKADDLKRANW
jgi:2-polyprenyl-6-methoxyphenol hydroxylase-like FAD-dependent oxidoreductase